MNDMNGPKETFTYKDTFEITVEKNMAYCEKDHRGIGWIELAVSYGDDDLVDIRNTSVASMYRNQGIGSALVQAMADRLRKDGRSAIVSCPFAKQWFEEHEDYQDVLN